MLSEKVLREIEKVRAGAYDMRYHEAVSFLQMREENGIIAIHDAFKYGFMKGQRAAKAATKRKAEKA